MVSGTKKYAYTVAAVQSPPQIKKTLGPRFPYLAPTKYGETTARIVFHNQFEAVERPTPRDRIGRGKVSPITTQAVGYLELV